MFVVKVFAALAALWLFLFAVIFISLFYSVISNNFGAAMVTGVLLYLMHRKGRTS